MNVAVAGLEFAWPATGFRLAVPRLELAGACAITGPSGCGKTTLLQLIAGIRTPRAGTISVGDTQPATMTESARRAFRIASLGLVFQEFELLDYLDVLDNVLLPYRISGALRCDDAARSRAADLVASVGLGDKLRRRARRLSHGERQRVAACRALIAEPSLVLADEPTGNLDPASRDRVLDVLFADTRRREATLVVVTHDREPLDRFDAVHDLEAVAS